VLEPSDIQGIVFSGYQKKPFATYLMLDIVEPALATAWLRSIAECVTTGADRPADTCLNIALTASALTALGLDRDALSTFPLELREGMAGSETRSRTLGDVEDNHPDSWLWGGPNKPVHVLLMLYARTENLLEELVAQQESRFSGALRCVRRQDTQSLPDRREHFGFADGIAQPVIDGAPRTGVLPTRTVEAGEFLLGHKNEYGKLPFVPNVAPERDPAGQLPECQTEGGKRRSLGHNGSYLVVRQLDQHVHEFWSYMREYAGASGDAIELAAKCVGRWPSGAPLTLSPDRDRPALGNANTFGYWLTDREGQRCPVGAHIRRANPRDSLEPDPHSSLKVSDRHRIMRRGRSYGPAVDKPWSCESDDGVQRGLMFMGVNANIRRQFEFIQQTWINNPKFSGLYDEVDPLIGRREGIASAFSIPSTPVRRRCTGLPRFVRVRGGEYFFLPGLRALRFLTTLRQSATDAEPVPSR